MHIGLIMYRDDAGSGGGIRVGEALAFGLTRMGIRVTLLFAYGGPGPLSRSVSTPVIYLQVNGSRDFLAWNRSRETVREAKFDVLHFIDAVLWLTVATIGLPIRKVVHIHGRPILGEKISLFGHFIGRWLRLSCDHQIAISRGAKDWSIRLGWASPENISVVYNAIDTARFLELPRRLDARYMLGLPNDKMLLGFVGRLVWWKGGKDFLKLLTFLPSHWHGVVVGSGPDEGKLSRLAVEMGIQQRLHFIGLLEDVRSGLAALDAFGFFSHYEPFGLVIAEAMAARVPVFGMLGDGEYYESDYPLVTEQNSTFVPRAKPLAPRVPEEQASFVCLAERLCDYEENAVEYDAKINTAQKWVIERFDTEVFTEQVMKIYAHVLEPGRRVASS